MSGGITVVRSPFVGRQRELTMLVECLAAAQAGETRIVLIAGEPGIGKSRLLRELGERARDIGWEVLEGRAYEAEGMPPYLLFVEALRDYVRACPEDALRSRLGESAADVALIVPDIRQRLPDLGPIPPRPASGSRYRLFEAMADFLLATAVSVGGLLLCLDDLHWADRSTLLLVQHLARRFVPGRVPLVMIGAHRGIGLDRDHPLLDVLANLTRERRAERLALGPLSRSDTAALVAGLVGSTTAAALADAIHRRSEGNPFFAEELVRHFSESDQGAAAPGLRVSDGAGPDVFCVPESVRQVIGRRLARLSPDANGLLQVAAVLGDGFDFGEVALVATGEEPRLLDVLEETLRAGILREDRDAYHFTHALIRQTILDEMSLARRQRLHLRVAEALERAPLADPGPSLAKLAVHYRLAGALVDRSKAMDYARRAGERAVAAREWEAATVHWRAALDLMGPTADRRRCEFLLDLGEIERRAGDLFRAMETFRRAATEARRLADSQLLARAALGFEEALLPSGLPRADAQSTSILLLEEALAALADGSEPLAARVLAALARAIYFVGERERGTALSEQAVALARRAGDPAALAYALVVRRIAVWGPDHPEERLAVAGELLRLADAMGDSELALEGRQWRLATAFELGDMPAVAAEIEASAQLAAALREPQPLSDLAAWKATLALMDGRLDDAERFAREARDIGERAQSQNAIVDFAVQMIMLRREQWRLDELRQLESVVRGYADQYQPTPSWRPLLALLAADLGNLAEARRIVDELAAGDLLDFPRNWLWLPIMAFLSETCVALGDDRLAEMLYGLLLPFADRNVTGNTAVACLGSASYFLGSLATLLRRWEDAARHFEAALAMNQRMGLKPWFAHTLRAYAHLLITQPRRRATELERARAMLAHAVAIYHETGVERGRIEAIELATDRRLAVDRQRRPVYPDRLTVREAEVLRLLAATMTNREIADRLFLSVRTVERHIENIYAKTGLHDRRAARHYALHHRIIVTAEDDPA
jgi:DNA-binding CsgD family transcriptional regulator